MSGPQNDELPAPESATRASIGQDPAPFLPPPAASNGGTAEDAGRRAMESRLWVAVNPVLRGAVVIGQVVADEENSGASTQITGRLPEAVERTTADEVAEETVRVYHIESPERPRRR